jgi:hypothetical protein
VLFIHFCAESNDHTWTWRGGVAPPPEYRKISGGVEYNITGIGWGVENSALREIFRNSIPPPEFFSRTCMVTCLLLYIGQNGFFE